jgi:hypothetical protein
MSFNGYSETNNTYTVLQPRMWFKGIAPGVYGIKAYRENTSEPNPVKIPFYVSEKMWQLSAYPRHVPITRNGDIQTYNAEVVLHTALISTIANDDKLNVEVRFYKEGEYTTDVVHGEIRPYDNINRFDTSQFLVGGVGGDALKGVKFPISVSEPGEYRVEITVRYEGLEMPAISESEFTFTAVGAKLDVDSETTLPIDLAHEGAHFVPLRKWPASGDTSVQDIGFKFKGALKQIPESGYSSGIKLVNNDNSLFYGYVDGIGNKFVEAEGVVSGVQSELSFKTKAEGEGHMSPTARVEMTATYTIQPIILQLLTNELLFSRTETPAETSKTILGTILADKLICGDIGVKDVADNQTVFDLAANPGKCSFDAEGNEFESLSTESKDAVWSLMEWHLESVGQVTNQFAAVEGFVNKKKISLNSMPLKNSDFGEKTLTLRFKDKPDWAVYKKLTFRFNRDGVMASEHRADNVVSGNPNWYVYWQQAAKDLGFGPKCKMQYDGPHPTDAVQLGKYLVVFSDHDTWTERIHIWEGNKINILRFLKTIHHENGHRDSAAEAPEFGGWGLTADGKINYRRVMDKDFDGIPDVWEQGTEGQRVGFADDETLVGTEKDKDLKLDAWEHGWNTIAEFQSPTNHTYTNPDGYKPATKQGLCVRNEIAVIAKEHEMPAKDWSFVP